MWPIMGIKVRACTLVQNVYTEPNTLGPVIMNVIDEMLFTSDIHDVF